MLAVIEARNLSCRGARTLWNICKDTRMEFYKTMDAPTLLYGSVFMGNEEPRSQLQSSHGNDVSEISRRHNRTDKIDNRTVSPDILP